MTKRKCPYAFTARSRAAMIEAIEAISSPYYERPGRYPFSWNVKDYSAWPEAASELNPYHPEGQTFNTLADDAWREKMQGEGFYWQVIEDARTQVEDWSDYDDKADYQFGFGGRSGGWLILESCHGIKWRDADLDDVLAELPFDRLRQLYRGLVVMESDFARDKVESAIRHALAWLRYQWEEERRGQAEATREELGELVGTLRSLSSELRHAALPPMIDIATRATLASLSARSRGMVAELRTLDGKGLRP